MNTGELVFLVSLVADGGGGGCDVVAWVVGRRWPLVFDEQEPEPNSRHVE